MPLPYVDGAAVLQHVAGSGSPSTATPDEEWADTVAAAVNAAIKARLDDGALTPTTDQDAELEAAALQDAAQLYMARKSPNGLVSFGPDGSVVRQGSSLLRAADAILYRISPGIG